MTSVQATVLSFDESTRSGRVLLDDGRELAFSSDAFAAGALRLLRAGQRVRLDQADDGEVESITIATMGEP